MSIVNSLTELIGNTPMLSPDKFLTGKEAKGKVFLKLEYFNPGGSVKDRIALGMIEDAEKKGLLKKGSVIIEPTSGNTGIGISLVAACKGYKSIIVMPETMSVERRMLISAHGAQIVLTPGAQGMKGAIAKAEALNSIIPDSLILQQFNNPANPATHRETTAKEIWRDLAGEVDYFIAGAGTGGTISGVGQTLKELNPDIKIIAVEPFDSPVLSGGNPGPHKIQGIGAGFVPPVFDDKIVDEIFKVRNQEAIDTSRELGRTEGLLVGISSGAAAFAALNVARRLESANKNIVALLPDTGERYLSTELYRY
ncbi:cysteine synthase A [Butyrivibrio sp. ob235]|uniref:cysteine synthase A n=1 Tax=Butyrivibrio sp. ob235 TaxID=1761780 RepID=UPI0008D04AF3|nr:cysteine synthase A [Butyrivibrio sp. ob235]SEL03745.1 cysteine synthase A [Butyrivibrio sp. ob235]